MILISTLMFTNMFAMTSEAATTSTGWKHNDIGWWYVTNKSGSYYKNTWQKINGKWYYFKKDGYMASAEYWGGYWVNPNGSWTYVPKATWKKNPTGWWYGDTAGWFAKGRTYEINGVKYHFNSRGYWGADWEKNGNYWYYIDQNGKKITNSIMTINKVKYFFDKTGKMVTNSFITANGHKYFFKSSGAMAINSWITSNSNKYYANANGYIVTGLQTISGNKYYFDKNGVMQKNTEVTINNVTYTIDSTGKCTEKKNDPVDPDPVQPGTEDPIGGDDPIIVDPPTPSHTHTWETVAAKEPTCTEIGWNEYKKCTDCDTTEGYTEIPALGHDMKSEVIAPTCTTDGYTRHWCDRCETVFENTDIVESTGHNFTEIHKYSDEACTNEITEVSCDQSYWYKKKCTKCESWTEAKYHNAGEHFWSNWTVSKEATCKEDGEKTRICQNCGKKETRTISKETVAHTYTDNWTVSKIATCAEDGEEERFCTVCGEGRETRTISKETVPHTYEVKTVNVELVNGEYVATTCDPNKETYWYNHCTVCEHDDEKHYVNKKTHIFTGETKYYTDKDCTIEAPEQLDCETTYYYKTKCINCDTWSNVKVREAGQHNWIDDTSKEDIKSTCHTHGTHYKKCSICGKQDEDKLELDYTNHEGIEVSDNNAVAATCQNEGLTASTHCSVCGNTITSQTEIPIDPKNHIGELVIDEAVAATCQHTGLKEGSHWNCCGKVEVEQEETDIDPNNHEHTSKAPDIFEYYMEMEDGTIEKDTIQNFQDVTNSKYYRYHGTNTNYEIEEGWKKHWFIYNIKELKYYNVQDYTSYSSFDVSLYWWKNFGIILDPNDYTTYIIPENPLVIAQAEIEGITPEQLVEKFTDYVENPRTLHSYPYNNIRSQICQDENSAIWVKVLCQPASTGNVEAWIRKGTCYQVQIHTAYCRDEGIRFETSREEPKKLWDAETVDNYTLPYGN